MYMLIKYLDGIHGEYNRINRFGALKILAWEYLYIHIAFGSRLKKTQNTFARAKVIENLIIENKYSRNKFEAQK